MIKMILSNPVLRIPFLIASAAGAVAAVAGGYYTIYRVVTFVGN